MNAFWKSWLQIWCWLTLGVGAMFAIGAIPAADGGVRLFYDTIYWPVDGQSGYNDEVRLTAALLGAVMIGWAITIFGLIAAAETVGPSAWRTLTFAMLAWWAIDSTISVALGAPVNAVSNTLFLAGYLAPVLASGVLGGAKRLAPA
jgi:hypothetical protein